MPREKKLRRDEANRRICARHQTPYVHALYCEPLHQFGNSARAALVANFCRSHGTLAKANGGVHASPAMAAGLTDHVWTIEEMLGMMDPKRRITS